MCELKLYILFFTVLWKPLMIRKETIAALSPIVMVMIAILWIVDEKVPVCWRPILLDMKYERFKTNGLILAAFEAK